jgi:hypothetical protein
VAPTACFPIELFRTLSIMMLKRSGDWTHPYVIKECISKTSPRIPSVLTAQQLPW